jgi:formylglycine-generating enzyme required for sulfatase activity
MRKVLVPAAATFAFMVGASAVHALSIDLVPVGNPGNAGNANDHNFTQVGAVSYNYQIGRTEVSNAQYAEFLNAVDPTGVNLHALYNPKMSNSASGAYDTGGIDFTAGAASGTKYSVKSGKGNNPVIWVSWDDAARFVNWLHNGQGVGTTELGVYDMTQTNPARSANATWVLPNRDEWVKAAFYDPSKSGGAGYYNYANRSDTAPTSENPISLVNPTNSANFISPGGAYAVTGNTTLDTNQNYLTDVGAYTQSQSAYGTRDQDGNVFEWNETLLPSVLRETRGGDWSHVSFYMQATNYIGQTPGTEANFIGFRVALVPEPASLSILSLSALALTRRRRRA